MKKIILSLFISFFICVPTFANEIQKHIKQSGFGTSSTVGIYVIEKKSDKVLYKRNELKLLNPASTMKVLVFGSSYLTLGKDYKFETSVYKDSKNNLFVKLGADPLLTQENLNNLFKELKTKFDTSKIQNIYIDDYIIDKNPYPNSWMAEDMWPNSRPLSPYIIDKNYVNIAINRSSLATKIDIIQNDDYKMPVINELQLMQPDSNIQEIKIERPYGQNSPIINFKGQVSKDEILKVPVLDPELNFNIKLLKALEKNNIKYDKKIKRKKLHKDSAEKLVSTYHTIEDVSKEVLLNSDNFTSEIVFRVAAAKYIDYKHPATLDDAIDMFKEEFKQFYTDGITIKDGSGVSRYNLVNTEFCARVLKELCKDDNFKNLMATPKKGTLKNRLLFLENNLRAKTGTLTHISCITGTMKTRKNREVVFSIMIQNSPKRMAVIKNFENGLIGIIYKNF